jgi:hypothetical protein
MANFGTLSPRSRLPPKNGLSCAKSMGSRFESIPWRQQDHSWRDKITIEDAPLIRVLCEWVGFDKRVRTTSDPPLPLSFDLLESWS